MKFDRRLVCNLVCLAVFGLWMTCVGTASLVFDPHQAMGSDFGYDPLEMVAENEVGNAIDFPDMVIEPVAPAPVEPSPVSPAPVAPVSFPSDPYVTTVYADGVPVSSSGSCQNGVCAVATAPVRLAAGAVRVVASPFIHEPRPVAYPATTYRYSSSSCSGSTSSGSCSGSARRVGLFRWRR
jgi:hypothetical protein